MGSQTEEGADLTSPEEVEGVAKEDSAAGTMGKISASILDPLNPAGAAFPVIKSLISCFTFGLFPDRLPGSPFRPGKGRGGGGGCRGQGRGRARDRDRDGKGGSKALPRSLASTRSWNKRDDGIRSESSSRPLQKIFMTNENQEQLKELLRDLQSQEYDETYG